MEVEGEPFLVLGIENFELQHDRIVVHYTCQRLNDLDAISGKKVYKDALTVGLHATIPHNKWDLVKKIKLGTTHYVRGECYKIVEYEEISLKGTDLYLSFLARPVYPVDRKEARSKLLGERRKKLRIEVL